MTNQETNQLKGFDLDIHLHTLKKSKLKSSQNYICNVQVSKSISEQPAYLLDNNNNF